MSLDVQVVEGSLSPLDLEVCKRVAEELHEHYPGHLWAVDIDGPLLTVRNLALSGNWGFRVFTTDFASASEMDRKIMLAGGELLERYRQRRARIDAAAIQGLRVDFAGRHTPST